MKEKEKTKKAGRKKALAIGTDKTKETDERAREA